MNRPDYWLTNWRLLLAIAGLLLALNLGTALYQRWQQPPQPLQNQHSRF